MAGRQEQSLDHVKDDSVRKQMEEEREKQGELSLLRQEINGLRDERDKLREKEQPAQKKELDAIDEEIAGLRAKKDALMSSILSSKEQVGVLDRRKIFDHLRIVEMELRPLERRLKGAMDEIDGLSSKATKLRKEAKALQPSCSYKSVDAVDKEIASLGKKMKQAQEKGHDSIVKNLKKDLSKAESDRSKVAAWQAKVEEHKKEENRLEELLKKCEEDQPKMEKMKASHADLEKQLNALPPAPTDEEMEKRKGDREKRHLERTQLEEQIDAKYREKEGVFKKYATGKALELNQKFDAAMKKRKGLEEELATIVQNIPKSTFTVDSQFVPDLIGPGGANVDTIQEDFGVIIDVRRQEGKVTVKGTNHEDCKAAIESMMEVASKNRHTQEMEIDPEMSSDFIGSSGSKIQLMESTSGCSINLESKTGKIQVVGTQENVEIAVKLINEFKNSSFRSEVKYDRSVEGNLRVGLMKQWQDTFGCSFIRRNRDTHTISITGMKDAVEKAAKHIEEFVTGLKDAVVIPIPSTVRHYVLIGKSGERVKNIESETGCILDISAERVKIAGSKASVEKATQLINMLITENIQDKATLSYPPLMHNYLIRRRPRAMHADPNAEEAKGSPTGSPSSRGDLCILEEIRQKYNCDRVQADPKLGKIQINAPKSKMKEVIEALKAAINQSGMHKEKLLIDNAVVRYLCQNINERGARGVKTRLDPLRNAEGIVDIAADFRGEKKDVEIIGKDEAAVGKAKAELEAMAEAIASRMIRFKVPANRVGRLLGPGGSNLNQLEREYECMFHVPKTDRSQPPAPDAEVEVTVIAADVETADEARSRALLSME